MENQKNSRASLSFVCPSFAKWVALSTLAAGSFALAADPPFDGFIPGNLVVSRSVYMGTASTVTVGQALPPNCPATAACSKPATNDGTYPNVFNNAAPDPSFGITSPIFLDQITTEGAHINTFAVPTTRVITSFSSKSELALNLSPEGDVLTFMGYVVPGAASQVNLIDISNSNTPGVADPTNPVGETAYRAVVQLYPSGGMEITDTNAYSGNNGRAAVQVDGYFYMVGNSNNGTGTAANLVNSTGAEIAIPGQDPATVPQQIGNFSIAQVTDPSTGNPYAADKAGKDNNFRGLTYFDGNIYITKGSGSNGINTIYRVGLPHVMPTLQDAASAPITILPGFTTTLAKNAGATNPFGLWFANANTLYVSDEGDGTTANAATSQAAGLQKWALVNGVWQLAYVLQNGLNLGQQYTIANYPTSLNPATDGLRNITGRNNGDGTVTIWAITSTISANGDQGADPNKLVAITDVLANSDPALAAYEPFTTLMSAGFGEVLRGVSFTPGTVTARRGRR